MAGVKRGGGGREADRQNTTVMSLNTITNSKYINNVIIHLCMYEIEIEIEIVRILERNVTPAFGRHFDR